MTDLHERYLDGYSFGYEQAERMLFNKTATSDLEAEHRAEAHTAVDTAHTPEGRKMAAWRLGVVRGFRQVVR